MDTKKRLRGAFHRVISECITNYEYEDDVDDVRKCVEKQIPLQPIMTTNPLSKIDLFDCNYCGHIIDKTYNYCPCCGQRIEWDEDKWKK